MTAFPNIWVPDRKLWTPSEWFTAGKAQRKSDGKLPRKTSTGTAGKTPRNIDASSTCCCTPPLAVCPCNGTTGTYQRHLTLVVSSVSIPLNTCLYNCGNITGNSQKILSITINGTYCLSYVTGGILGGGPCIYTFTDTSASSVLLDNAFSTPCVSALTGLVWRVDLDVINFQISRVFIIIDASSGFLPFDTGTVTVPLSCGGTSSSINNIATYCTSQPGPNVGTTAIPGSVTVQDGGC